MTLVNLFTPEFENQRNLLSILLEERVIDIDGAVDQLVADFPGVTPVDALDLLIPEDMYEAILEFETVGANN